MANRNTSIAVITGCIIALASTIGTPANAACVNSGWQKTSGNSLADTIRGRQCGANMSVRLTGIVDTGWIAMHNSGPGSLSATFVDNNVSTAITMLVNGKNMNVFFTHTANNGAVTSTQGHYVLVHMQ